MKRIILIAFLILIICRDGWAQTRNIGPVEQKMTTALCDCITGIDQSKIMNSKEAGEAFMNCFISQSSLLVDLATERNVSMTDNTAMHKLGEDIGKNLLTQKCDAFLKLAVKMANKGEENQLQTTAGTFKRIDTKGFNYIIITDENGSEKPFLWLKQFNGSEKFINAPATFIGKKLTVSWQEIEVYLPLAKGYYKVKEITGIEVP
ncbi:hypothetical protein [Mucilaginibacter sp. UR6-11]|uniref:hypothetical protein n=1 Tax=Mucilaginibacter sp. UR6-11 TaxID=1435644 RepID=UPI001E3C04D5|nr:hypothetical protein [Mucilaginibacter sp. UR6-11]MCC8424081.1 hypothetical protein [Mucilaginibacter sp. UR6-11]